MIALLTSIIDAALGVFTLALPDLIVLSIMIAVLILIAQVVLAAIELRPRSRAANFRTENISNQNKYLFSE